MAAVTRPSGAELAVELRLVLRRGLPVLPHSCGPTLAGLRGVRARAARPDDPLSCSQALDSLLRELIEGYEDRRLAPAVRHLFGLGSGSDGARLTERRQRAAAAAGYEVNHFRKRIEPQVLERLAWQLERDGLCLAAAPASAPPLRMGRDRLHLPPDVYAWEAADHQAALARLWACAYHLRAELLVLARLLSMGAPRAQLDEVVGTAMWRAALSLREAADYRSAYGAVLLQEGEARGPDDVVRSAGWTPHLEPAQALFLVSAARRHGSRKDFLEAMEISPDGARLAETWRRAFGHPNDGPEGE